MTRPASPRPAMPDFLGTGWAFPPSFGEGGAQVQLVSAEEDIHQSLQILFATRLGERALREDYGCNLDSFLFAEIDHELLAHLRGVIENAVLAHESRIRLEEIEVSPDDDLAGVLAIRLDYTVLGTNSRFNMVFPFHVNEATAVQALRA
jgi:hypothetical protein